MMETNDQIYVMGIDFIPTCPRSFASIKCAQYERHKKSLQILPSPAVLDFQGLQQSLFVISFPLARP